MFFFLIIVRPPLRPILSNQNEKEKSNFEQNSSTLLQIAGVSDKNTKSGLRDLSKSPRIRTV